MFLVQQSIIIYTTSNHNKHDLKTLDKTLTHWYLLMLFLNFLFILFFIFNYFIFIYNFILIIFYFTILFPLFFLD